MNLGKLLGAGKSFVSGGKAAAYREHKHVYLPKFESPKNPFANVPVAATQAELPVPAETPVVELKKKTGLMTWAKKEAKSPVVAGGATARASTWTSKLNPAALFRPMPDASDKIVVAIQPELSLEKVKVVHNDLTDADVEVVPMKSRPAPAPSAPELIMSKRPWEVLGERILKVTAL